MAGPIDETALSDFEALASGGSYLDGWDAAMLVTIRATFDADQPLSAEQQLSWDEFCDRASR